MVELPEHIVDGAAEAVTTGVVSTTTGTLTGALGQRVASIPITEYVVLVSGDTLTVDPVSEPGCHV